MHTRRVFTASLLTITAAAATLLATGCASTPPVTDKMTIDPMGTVTTYHRKSSGSLGTFDGKVVWTHAPATWQAPPPATRRRLRMRTTSGPSAIGCAGALCCHASSAVPTKHMPMQTTSVNLQAAQLNACSRIMKRMNLGLRPLWLLILLTQIRRTLCRIFC